MRNRIILLLTILLVLAVGGTIALLVGGPEESTPGESLVPYDEEPPEEPDGDGSAETSAGADSAGESGEDRPRDDRPTNRTDTPRAETIDDSNDGSGDTGLPTVAGEASTTAEAIAAEERPAYLGNPKWMAEVSPDEETEIEAAFDALPEPDPRVTRRDRKSSIEAARVVVEDCFRALRVRQPGIRGRVAVAWTATASGGQGVITNPEITLNLKLREDAFEDCIVIGLDGLRFPAVDNGEPLRVEYPYFFDRM